MVSNGISVGGRKDIHIIQKGTLKALKYADETLRPCILPNAVAIVNSLLFLQDNASPHTALIVEKILETETIQRMESLWSASYSDGALHCNKIKCVRLLSRIWKNS